MNSSAVLGSKEGIDYAPLTTADSLPSNLAWALDIDLDYFCWNDYPELPECMLEVPESVYDDFRLDRYHFLRLSLNAKTAAVKRDGKFYLAFEYVPRPEPHVTAQAIVAKRIDDFIAYLSRHRADPRIITLCRSRHSGYVQSRNLEFAESLLLERLHSITPFEKHSIDDLLAQHLLPEEVFHGTPVQPEEHQYA
jgi:hypothetical protein